MVIEIVEADSNFIKSKKKDFDRLQINLLSVIKDGRSEKLIKKYIKEIIEKAMWFQREESEKAYYKIYDEKNDRINALIAENKALRQELKSKGVEYGFSTGRADSRGYGEGRYQGD